LADFAHQPHYTPASEVQTDVTRKKNLRISSSTVAAAVEVHKGVTIAENLISTHTD